MGTPCGQVARGDPPLPPPITPRSVGHLGRVRRHEGARIWAGSAQWHEKADEASLAQLPALLLVCSWHHPQGPKGEDLMPGQEAATREVTKGRHASRAPGRNGPEDLRRERHGLVVLSSLQTAGRHPVIDRVGDPTDNVRPAWHEHEAALAELWHVHRRAVSTLMPGRAHAHRLRRMADRQARRPEEPALSREITRR